MLEHVTVTCPHCWESIDLALDLSVAEQSYVEDCSVCCAPIVVSFTVENGVVANLTAVRE